MTAAGHRRASQRCLRCLALGGLLALIGPIDALGMSMTTGMSERRAQGQGMAEAPLVAFSSHASDTDDRGSASSRLFVVGLDGGTPRRVTEDDVAETAPTWSPDGKLLAFARSGDIAVVEPDGTGLRVIADTGSDPQWSPDGERIVFTGDDGVRVVSREGSDLRRLTDSSDDGRPVWSPDGERVAFERVNRIDFGLEESDVYVVEVDSGTVQRFTSDGDSGAPRWSPDGGLLSFSQHGDLIVTRPDGTDRRVVATAAGAGFWSPEGTRLAFIDRSSGRPAVVDADGGERRVVGAVEDGSGPIAWSPGGTSLVLAAFRSGGGSGGVAVEPEGDLYAVGLDDGETRQLSDLGTAFGPAVPPGPPFVERVSGSDRVGTAVEVSKAAFPDPQACPQQNPCAAPEAVVVARADAYADALAAGPLAVELAGPLLLTPPQELPPEVTAEAQRLAQLGARRAVVVGGPAAASPRVEQQLTDLGLTVERVAGTDRYATAAAIAARLDTTDVYVVEGADPDPARGWPDAIAVSGLAARQRRPLLLATTDSLPQATADALEDLDVTQATIVGGTAAVSSEVEQQVAARVERVDRLAGDDRYDTSALVADAALADGAEATAVVLASGADWPDGLTASSLTATTGVLLLTDPDSLDDSPPTRTWLADHATAVHTLTVVGGPAAINPRVASQARTTIAGSR